MKVKKNTNVQMHYNAPDIIISKDNVIFKIMFGGNGDLCWAFFDNTNPSSKEIEIEITELDNVYVYEALDELYERIANCKIHSAEDLNRKYKHSYNYDDLYKDGVIHWKSDERDERYVGNVFISKKDDAYKITYKAEENINGWDDWFLASIRFRSSGSSYGPAYMPFVDMYNKLCEVEDLNKTPELKQPKGLIKTNIQER